MNKLGRKLNKTPIRSPSPDIANRHVIGRTPSPINDAINKSRKNLSNKIPLGKSFMNNGEYEASIDDLEYQNKLLSNENQILSQDLQRCKNEIEFLKEMNMKNRKEYYKKI